MKKTNTQNPAVEFDPTELAVLETLIHTNDYVSGNTLAKSIGISRTTIHTKIDQLKIQDRFI